MMTDRSRGMVRGRRRVEVCGRRRQKQSLSLLYNTRALSTVLIYGSINDLVPAFEWQKCLLNAWMLGAQIVDELLVGDDFGAIRRAAVWKCRRVDATRHDGEGNAEAQCDVYDSFGGLITVHADEKRWLSIGEEVADAGFATPHVVADVRKRRHVRFIIVILCMQLRGVTNDSGNLTREYILRRLGELSGIGGWSARFDVFGVFFTSRIRIRDQPFSMHAHALLALLFSTSHPYFTAQPRRARGRCRIRSRTASP